MYPKKAPRVARLGWGEEERVRTPRATAKLKFGPGNAWLGTSIGIHMCVGAERCERNGHVCQRTGRKRREV